MVSTERCLCPSPNSVSPIGPSSSACPKLCFPLPPLTLLLLLYPNFHPPINCQVLSIFPPIYLLCLPFSFIHTVTLLLSQHLLPLRWPHQQPNRSSWLQDSQFQYTSGTASRVVFPKHKADLVIHLLNVLPTTIEVKLNDFNMAY